MKMNIIRRLHYWAIKVELALSYWRMEGKFAAARQGWKDVDLFGYYPLADDPAEADFLADLESR